MTDPSFSQSADTPLDLYAGEFERVTEEVTILSGENLSAGAVVGKITASGKYVLSNDGAADGSETAEAILAQDVDASGGDKKGHVYRTGVFNENALTFGGAHTADTVRADLRGHNIYLKKAVAR